VCIILLRLAPDADEAVLLAANRDEFRDRAADDPAEIAPGVFAGRDRLAGGTWLAVGRRGLAAVTNIAGVAPRPDAPSRGQLPLAAVAGTLPHDLSPYSAFNLLVVDDAGARVLTHLGDGTVLGPTPLAAGLHVIVNAPFAHGESTRARYAASLLEEAPPGFDLLTTHGADADVSLCHHGDAYGTVSSTVIALDRALRVTRYLYRAGLPCRTPTRDLTAAARAVTLR
jgi:uncharacterized protein with NRDE domain